MATTEERGRSEADNSQMSIEFAFRCGKDDIVVAVVVAIMLPFTDMNFNRDPLATISGRIRFLVTSCLAACFQLISAASNSILASSSSGNGSMNGWVSHNIACWLVVGNQPFAFLRSTNIQPSEKQQDQRQTGVHKCKLESNFPHLSCTILPPAGVALASSGWEILGYR